MMSTLEDVWQKLNDSWDSQREMLTQLYDLKVCTSLISVECLLPVDSYIEGRRAKTLQHCTLHFS